MPEPDLMVEPVPTPTPELPMDPPCIETLDRGCISSAAFERIRDEAAAEFLAAPEFNSRGQWGLGTVNAHQAHAAISVVHGTNAKPGAGVTVGVIDSGIDFLHPAIRDGAVSETFAAGATDETGAGRYSHGTAVASIIAGRPVPGDPQHTGIAPWATLQMTAIPLGSAVPGVPFAPAELAALAQGDAQRAEFYRNALSQNPDILNNSFGIEGLSENYDDVPALRAAMRNTIEVAAQAGRPDKTILVWAAGNANEKLCRPGTANCVGSGRTDYLGRPAGTLDASSPELFAGLAAHIEELRDHSVAVVAVAEDGRIAEFSNRCGFAADWCIAAPGDEILLAYFGPDEGYIVRDYKRLSGTSFAAPMVSGGLALMKQFFRDQLPNTNLVARLYATADKSGIYADAATYGQGLMDLGAAVTPVGEATVTLGSRVGDAGHDIRTTRLQLGGALGDGLSRVLAGREIAAFDTLGAPFWYRLPGLAGTEGVLSTAARLRDLVAPAPETALSAAGGTRLAFARHGNAVARSGWRFGLHESPTNAESSLLNLAGNAATLAFGTRDGLQATAFTTAGFAQRKTSETGAVLAWRPPDGPFGARLGWLGEGGAMLGSTAHGAFGRLSADGFVVGVEAGTDVAGWRLAADAELGPGRSGRARRYRRRHVGPDHERGFVSRRPAPDGR